MSKKILAAMVVLTLICCVSFGTVDTTEINFDTVTSGTFDQSLRGWFSTLNTDISNVDSDNLGTGSVFYVDSGAAAGGAGTSWSTAHDTLQEGIDACTDNAGDIIYVAAEHEEDVGSAAALLFDCPGITVIGFGSGDEMPEFSLTALASTVSVTAPDVTIYNLRFLGDWANGSTLGLDVQATGDGFRVLGCEFRSNSSDEELLIALNVTAAAHNLVIVGNSFVFETGGDESSAIVFEGASNKTVVSENYFNGDWSGYVIDASGATSVQMLIENNIIHNLDATQGYTMTFAAASTGDIIGNKCYGVGAAQAIVGNAMFVSPDNVTMTTEDVETRTYEAMMGSFTGASGAGQGASIYADMVLAQADLDAILVDGDRWDTAAEAKTLLFGSDANGATATALATTDAVADAVLVDTGTTLPATLAGINTSIASIDATGFAGTCTSNPANTSQAACTTLANFGDDYFNTGWSLVWIYNLSSAGTYEGETQDIIDYDSGTGLFTLNVAASEQITTGDAIWIRKNEELNLNDTTMLGTAGGTIRYVDSVRGATGSGAGDTWENAYATVALAEAACAAGDIVYIADGHDEDIGDVLMNVANVSFIGMGEGDARPLLTCDAGTDEITLDAAGITVKNLRLQAGADQVVAAFRVENAGIGCTIENVSFIVAEGADEEFVICVDVDADADQLTVKNCTYYNTNATTAHASCFVDLSEIAIQNTTIIGCNVFGEFANGCIYWTTSVPLGLAIIDNTLSNTTSTKFCINGSGAATGVWVNNKLYSDSYLTMYEPGSLMAFGNVGTDAIDQQSITIPLSAETSDVGEVAAGSNLERLEWLQKQTDDIASQLGIDSTADNVFYVDASVAGGSGLGTSWIDAEATLVLAIGDATTNTGAYIFVASNHAENLVGSVAVNKAGISIIGLGVGESRPIFTFDTANDSLAHTVPDVKYKNLIFTPSTQDNTVGISLDASSDGAIFEDCVFRNNTTNEFTNLITLAGGCDDVRFTRCQFINDTAIGGHVAAIENVSNPVDNLIIEDCQFHGTFTTAAIHSTKIDTNLMIRNNTIYNYSTSDYAIKLTTTALGTMYGNKCYTPTYGTCIDPGSLQCFDNYISHVIDESGFLFPSAPVTIPAVEGTGRIIYVDSGATAGGGGTWATALNTINAAMDLTSASRGDTIYVAAGHAETVTGATGAVMDIIGVKLVGLGTGALRPTITFTTAIGATISVTAADCTIENMILVSNFATGITAGITAGASADGLTVDNVEFRDSSNTTEMFANISLAAACDDVTIKNCYFSNTAASAETLSAVLFVAAVDNCQIINNRFHMDAETASILGSAGAGTNVYITDNTFFNIDTGGLAISLNAATTGIVVRNLAFGNAEDTSPFAAAGCMVAENYGSNGEGESGIIWPAVDN